MPPSNLIRFYFNFTFEQAEALAKNINLNPGLCISFVCFDVFGDVMVDHAFLPSKFYCPCELLFFLEDAKVS